MHYRVAFTLTELLVVLAIVFVLFTLLIPRLNGLKDTARRNQCVLNLRNFAFASRNHSDSNGQLPGQINDYGTFGSAKGQNGEDLNPDRLPIHQKIGTWAVSFLPWLDCQPTHEIWTEDRYAIVAFSDEIDKLTSDGYLWEAAPNLAAFQCPSNPVGNSDFGGMNSYICNAGMHAGGPHGHCIKI